MIFNFEFNDGDEGFVERMWVKVTDISPGNYKGILDSKPTSIEESEHFWLGSEITFHPKRISFRLSEKMIPVLSALRKTVRFRSSRCLSGLPGPRR